MQFAQLKCFHENMCWGFIFSKCYAAIVFVYAANASFESSARLGIQMLRADLGNAVDFCEFNRLEMEKN